MAGLRVGGNAAQARNPPRPSVKRLSMRRFPLPLTSLLLALLMHLPLHAAPLERLQLAACRTTSSFMLLRGEGQQMGHLQRFEQERAGLQNAYLQLPPEQRQRLQPLYLQLLERLEQGLAFGPREDDLPWQYPEQLSRALVALLETASTTSEQPAGAPLRSALTLEFFTSLYLGQAYLGYFDITPAPDARFPNQSGEQLLANLDQDMQHQLPAMQQQTPAEARKVQAEWRYLRAALADFDSAGRARLGHSGKPLVPLVVSRYSRNLSDRLLAWGGG